MAESDRTASLMTPSKLAQMRPKALSSPAAWLSQMAADAGHQHVRRMAELCGQLTAQVPQGDVAPVQAGLGRLAEALPQLDFGLLQSRGWWARTTGKTRSAGAEFAAQVARIDEVARALVAPIQDLQAKQQEQTSTTDRTLVEIEVENHAIDKIIDQGARWLQDMRAQIKSREAGAADPAAQDALRQDAQRCEILVARLKLLRAVSSAAQRALEQAQAAAGRRAALLQLLRQGLAAGIKAWQARLSPLAASAAAGDSTALNAEAPMEVHRDLQLAVKQAIADCGQLQVQENAVADSLAALAQQTEAA